MSSVGPQQPELKTGGGTKRALGRLRKLPGFTTAAVAFVLIVLLGGGGAAVAKWNQSATVSMGITAGAAPAPSPTPTPSPSPTPTPTPSATPPPNNQGNIVANPVIAARPGLMDPTKVECDANGNSGKYAVSWPADASGNISYVASVSVSDKNYGAPQSQNVSVNKATFNLSNTDAAYGLYILRIQPMNGTVAGDPIYRTIQHEKRTQQCGYASPNDRSPLGSFSVNAVPASSVKTNNVLNVSWTALATGTDYKVSIVSVDTASSFGAEFTTRSTGATLTFPAYKLDGSGNPTNGGAYNGEYLLRVIPMNGTQAGDPVYKKVFYKAYEFRVENYQYQY
ncbi:hypothetical protein [Arthrobacter glacialis]|uniref:Uncharacterized protein n=1 Tax=Arthrobacter glacialis TaxID=1664 RepID=A0A2S4A0B2_ARTGL|nr:hypothetical protein [Arthrobacter glacialis]POH74920.1 hypothetical protein CVS27_03405 [Arthrobacter glacialis]